MDCERTTKLNSATIPWYHLVGGVWKLLTTIVRDECKLALKMALYRYFTRERLTYPTKVPSQTNKSKKRTQKWSVHQKRIPLGAATTTNTPEEHRLESSPLNMDPQRQSDNSESFCPRKFSFLYTAQPPYLHFDTSIEHSNWAKHSGYVSSRDNYVWHHCSQKQNRQIKIRQMELETNPPN